jgi:hypothetical protein
MYYQRNLFVIGFICFSVFNVYASGCTPDSYYYEILQENKWELMEIQKMEGKNHIDRKKINDYGNENLYTLEMCEKFITGTVNYSQFSTPYKIDGNSSGSIMVETITKTDLIGDDIHEIEEITEDEFYEYLKRLFNWRLWRNGIEEHWTLYLKTKDENGEEVLLVFSY